MSPHEVGAMSLWELFSTMAHLPKKSGPMPTEDEFEEGMDLLRRATAHDPSVRLH